MTRIIIVDDHRMFRESLRKILTIEKVAEVVAEAANGKEFLNLLDQHTPDLVLMDIAMPELNGMEATKLAIEKQPDIKVLCLSSFGDEKYYFNMVEAGAKGFVLKNAGINELENAIREVANGGSWFSSELLQKIIISLNSKPKKNATSELTERELEILKLVCESMTNEQIAEKINLSYDTVKWHRSNILSKTGCTNIAGLVIFAIKNQLIDI
jgi:DNA-binding NarL/FixJ family response regulator